MRLGATILEPAAPDGPWPTVLVRTPYKSELDANGPSFRRLLEKGYAIVQVHERGRFLSEGRPGMLRRAGEDGWDTLDRQRLTFATRHLPRRTARQPHHTTGPLD